MTTFSYKQGDSRPPLEYRLTDSDDNRINLSDASSVKLFIDDSDGTLLVNDTVEIVDEEQGEVKYEFGNQLSADVDDSYRAEFVIYWTDGREQTVPPRNFLTLQITETTARNIDPAAFDDPDATLTTLFVDEISANSGSTVDINATINLQGNDIQSAGAVDADSASISGQTTTGSLDTDRLYSKTRPASVVVYNDDGVAVAEDESSTIDTDTDVSQVINSAVANIGNGGDIFVRRGEYTASNTLTLDVDGVRLIGEGMPWKDEGQSGYGSVIKADSNVSTRLVALDHQFTGVDSLGLIGQYNVDTVVETTNIRDYRIQNCGIRGANLYNVFANSKNTWIVDNWIEFSDYANIRVSGGDAFHKSVIKGNMLVGVDRANGNGHIVLTGSNEVRILGNTMTRGGLGIWDFGSGMEDTIISDNVFRGIGRDASPESFSDYALYAQNSITGTSMHGNRVISDDSTGTPQTASLAGFASGATVSDVKLYGNNDTNLTGSRIVDNGNAGYTVGSNAV